MRQLACMEENLPADTEVVHATADMEVVDTSISDKEEGMPAWA